MTALETVIEPARMAEIELTTELAQALAMCYRDALRPAESAWVCGIRPGTLARWLKLGRQGEEPYAGLVRLLRQARAQGEHQRLRLIRRAANKGDWRAAAWTLERTQPGRYARPTALPQPTAAPAAATVRVDLGPYLDLVRRLPPAALPPPPDIIDVQPGPGPEAPNA